MKIPISIDKYKIYDIYHNDNNDLIIISPFMDKPLTITYKTQVFTTHVCGRKYSTLYVLKNQNQYKSEIEITINGTNVITQVNKYPEFKNEIIMSTIVKNEDEVIRQWIRFYKKIGITRFIIYDNNETSNLVNVVKDFIESGLVMIIKWNYPYRIDGIVQGQIAQQNHSIWAFQNSKYIGLFDVDEYVNMQTETHINTFFDKLIIDEKINTKEISSFKLLNKFFYNPNNLPTDGFNFLKIYSSAINCTLRGREKNFVIPKNVQIMCVHNVEKGKKSYSVSCEKLFFNHYFFLNKSDQRGSGKGKHMSIDNSIQRHTERVIKDKSLYNINFS